MKTLFFGTSDFAVPSLRVVAERTQLAGVVTQPDRPAGRGYKLTPTPVKVAAQQLEVPVYEPKSLRAFAREHAAENYELFVLASFGRILPQEILDLPRLGSFNVHPSLLPKYRGATPIQSAIREGETETGVTIMLMDAGMDTGDVVLQERTPIAPDERYGELHDRLAAFGSQALAHAIDLARSGHIPHRPQTGAPTLTRPLRKEDLLVDWNQPAKRIVDAVRAFAPAPAARGEIAGTTVKIRRAAVSGWKRFDRDPGAILGVSGDAVVIRSGDSAVDVLEVVPPNRGPITGATFAVPVLAKQWK